MAMARKCDRCGKVYTPKMVVLEIDKNTCEPKTGNGFAITSSYYSDTDGRSDIYRKPHDLCEDCLKDLDRWFAIGKVDSILPISMEDEDD